MSSFVAVLTPMKSPAPASICVDEPFDDLWYFQCVVSPRTFAHINDANAKAQVQKFSPDGSPRSPLPSRPGSFRDQANRKTLSICCDEFSGSDKSFPSSTELSPQDTRAITVPAPFDVSSSSSAEHYAVVTPSAFEDNIGELAATGSEIFGSEELAGWCISQAERQVLQRVFHTFDENRDGKISIEELGKVFEKVGIPKTEYAMASLLETMTLNEEGHVDEEEFLLLYKSICNFIDEFDKVETKSDTDRDVREAFELFDRDNNGFISPTELQSVLCCLGFAQDLDACVKMISRVDENGDGQVDFNEFKKMLGVYN